MKKKIPRWHSIVGWICAIIGLELFVFASISCYLSSTWYDGADYDPMTMLGVALMYLLMGIFFFSWGILLFTGIVAKMQKRPIYHWIMGNTFAVIGAEFWAAVFMPTEIAIGGTIIAVICTIVAIYYLFGIADYVRCYRENRKLSSSESDKAQHINESVIAADSNDEDGEAGLSKEIS